MPDATNKTARGKSRPLLYRLLLPLFFLLITEIVLLVGSLVLSGVSGELDRNARNMVNQQVTNRRNYIENTMVKDWSDLSRLSQEINDTLGRLTAEGRVRLEELDSSSEAAAPLLREITGSLISTLYTKQLNGVFVMLNTRALPERGEDCPGKPGIYIRDLDPRSTPSIQQADLLLERAPIAVVQHLNISTDAEWQPTFTFTEKSEAFYDCLRRPYQAALAAEKISASRDYGRWSTIPYVMGSDPQPRIAYVQPLVLPDGTVYGLLGVELMTGYVRSLLPYGELIADEQGSYLLGVTEGDVFTPIVVSGPAQQYIAAGDTVSMAGCGTGDGQLEIAGRSYHLRREIFSTYNSNTPFLSEQWTLVGLVAEKQLYTMSARMKSMILTAIVLVLAVGLAGTLAISRGISVPIRHLYREVNRAKERQRGIPQLSRTGISELDSFARAFTALSREVVDSSTKFLRIMDMASVEIGGFELRKDDEDRVFYTDNFFPMFGMKLEGSGLNAQGFRALLKQIRETVPHTDLGEGSTLYQLELPNGESRYLRVEAVTEDDRYIGLVEDVTAATQERLRIERERDYDLLTGLFSRRAFYRQAEELFRRPEELGHAALVMLDLDNLKQTNDRFGHDWGDKYIRQAGRCFASAVPEGTLCARVSGDEFYILFHGYSDRETIRDHLAALFQAIRSSGFELPNGEHTHISATGGVAWYPEDSTRFQELMQFADFAMYQVKQEEKGSLGSFDLGVYNRAHYLHQQRRDFQRLVMEEMLVNYHFQPIVSARTGGVFAYEALMRVDMLTLHNPAEVLEVARAEGQLAAVERLTWSRAMACYQELLDQGLVDKKALLFVNSIASETLDEETQQRLYTRYAQLHDQVVVELTETEQLDDAAIQFKRSAPGFAGMFALDDYGSGYNSEVNLLALQPSFIKVDASIIRDIDTKADKQRILENIVGYAHERDMLIVAEGVETAQELDCVLRLGADLLQGYFLARPAGVPGGVSEEAAARLRAFRRGAGPD